MRVYILTDFDLKQRKRELIEECAQIADDAEWQPDANVLAPENVCRITREEIAEKIRLMKDKA